jgi:uncharacterized protein YjbJ (UPF0337 family)
MSQISGSSGPQNGSAEGWSVSEYDRLDHSSEEIVAATREPMPLQAIDPIQELEEELARNQIGAVPVMADELSENFVPSMARAQAVSSPSSIVQPPSSTEPAAGLATTAEENFQAWRAMHGASASMEVEVVGADGRSHTLDLMRVSFDELPEEVKAVFEAGRAPNLERLLVRRSSIGTGAGADGARRDEDRSPDRQRETSKSARRTEDIPSVPHERRRATASGGFGVGLNLGGLAEGAGRVVEGAGRAIQDAGHAASGALSYLQASMRGLVGKQHDRALQRVRRWREQRAADSLESLQGAMKAFETALESARDRPDLKDAFRSWDSINTAAGRAKAMDRFRELCATGRYCEHVQEVVADLLKRAVSLRTHAGESLERVQAAGQDCEPLKRQLCSWLERMVDRAGPLSSASGESLAGALKELADAVSKMLSGLVQRMAQFAGQKMN